VNFPEEELNHRAMEKLKIFDMHDHALKKANQAFWEVKATCSHCQRLINDPVLDYGA